MEEADILQEEVMEQKSGKDGLLTLLEEVQVDMEVDQGSSGGGGGGCTSVPRQQCRTVQKQQCKSVPRQQCRTVNKQQCSSVPRQQCRNVPRQQCRNVPRQKCSSVPRQQCREQCKTIAWCKVCG